MKHIIFLILLVLSVLECSNNHLNYKIRYQQIHGLKKGDRIIFEQNDIGMVKRIVYHKKSYYLVDVLVNSEFENAATEHTEFFIITDPDKKERKAIEIVHKQKGGPRLKDGAMITGAVRQKDANEPFWDALLKRLEEVERQFEEFTDELQKIPESKAFKDLKKELSLFLEELNKSGKDVQEKLKKDVLPQLQREMERLRERLRKLNREDEIEPLEIKMEEIKQI